MVDYIHTITVKGQQITTRRLLLRPWATEDAEAALAVYGADEVSRWLAPALERVPDAAGMRTVVEEWGQESATLQSPQGRWAIELRESGEVVGGVSLLPLPPERADLEIGWQLAPGTWGLAAEAGHAVAHQAFERGAEEVFAVVRPRNERGAATARRVGMEWVGETDKYYGLRLQVYRLRKADLDDTGLMGPS
jgi:RimJ/RimL family protein N-acetyltransferase